MAAHGPVRPGSRARDHSRRSSQLPARVRDRPRVRARAYHDEFGGASESPAWLEPLLTFADPGTVYATYGKLWLFAFALFLACALCLRQDAWDRLGRPGRVGLAMMPVGLAMAAVGDVGDYWLGRAVLGQALWAGSFIATMLGILASMVGAVLLGVHARRTGALPGGVATAFLLAPAGILVNLLLIPNAPAAYVPAVAIGWMAWGMDRLRSATGS